MSGVFQNIDPPPSVRGEDTLAGQRGGWGVNILEDVRHSSKYFVVLLVGVTMASHLSSEYGSHSSSS